MASVYTTARGKNKKNKAKDQSKDGANNRATKFNAQLKAEIVTKDVFAGINFGAHTVERLGHASSTAKATRDRERLQRVAATKSCACPECPLLLLPNKAAANAGSGGEKEKGDEEEGEEEEDDDDDNDGEDEGEEETTQGSSSSSLGTGAGSDGHGDGHHRSSSTTTAGETNNDNDNNNISSPSSSSSSTTVLTLMHCPCGWAAYCSKECQKAHWKAHQPICIVKRAEAKAKAEGK